MKIFTLILLLALASTQAEAQQFRETRSYPCMTTVEMMGILKGFKEVHNAFGIESKQSIIVVYRTRDRKTWSVVQHRDNGISCIVAAGVDWEFINPFNFRMLPALPERKL
jgi:hypothetical protein